MIAHILGSAAGGGVPQWNCGCRNCVRARLGEIPSRSQSSIAVSADGESWILVNASVDIARQFAATPQFWITGVRRTPFVAILLTDANVDHTAGLGELRQQPQSFVVASTAVVRSLLVPQEPYSRFDRPPNRWLVFEPDEERDIAHAIGESISAGLDIRAIEVPGLLPGYAGRRPAAGAVVAFLIRDRSSEARLLVAPVFAEFDEGLARIAERCDVILVDGSFYNDGELQSQGGVEKTARGLGHAPIDGEAGTLSRIAQMRNRRIFVHLNNTNPVLDPLSEQASNLTALGCEVAYDGMRIVVERCS